MSGRKFRFHPDMARAWADYGQWSRTKERAADGTLEYRHGCRWNDAESRHLLGGYLSEGRDIPSLARRHRRGVNGITSQLSRLMGSPAQHTLMLQLWSIEMAEAPEHTEPPRVDPLTKEEVDSLVQLLRTLQGQLAGDAKAPPDAASADFSELERRALGAVFYGEPVAALTGRVGPEPAPYVDVDPPPAVRSKVPNADVIHAYADGKPVQYRQTNTGPWLDFTGAVYQPRLGCAAYGLDRWSWRVKPDPTVVQACVNYNNSTQLAYFLRGSAPNLELTFDDAGRLVGARVYEATHRAV